MGLLGDRQKDVEALVKSLGFEVNGNFILAYRRMNTPAKVATNLLLRVPSIGTNLVEKQYLIIFSADKLAIHRMKKDGETTIMSVHDIKEFNYRDGANNSIVFEFNYQNEKFSFYTYKDFSFRMKYIAENLNQLIASHFLGYTKA